MENSEPSVIIDENEDEYLLLLRLRSAAAYRLKKAEAQLYALPAEALPSGKLSKELSILRKEITEISKELRLQKLYYGKLSPQLQSEEALVELLLERS